jgi:DNA-directed RNA polymerase subunit M/transcription elongation factor TFIIS
MNFCIQCDNMYYIGISEKDSNRLTYYCRHCGHVNEDLVTDGMCVLDTKFKKGDQKFNHIINAYTKFDPTLPRIYNVKCPNSDCKSHASSTANVNSENQDSVKNAEIIYIRYDDQQLKFLYICTECDYVWKTDDSN